MKKDQDKLIHNFLYIVYISLILFCIYIICVPKSLTKKKDKTCNEIPGILCIFLVIVVITYFTLSHIVESFKKDDPK
jgi:flagellar biosynthesis protein FliQ